MHSQRQENLDKIMYSGTFTPLGPTKLSIIIERVSSGQGFIIHCVSYNYLGFSKCPLQRDEVSAKRGDT